MAFHLWCWISLQVLSLLRENPSLCVLLDIPGEDKGQETDFVAGILKPSYSVLGSNRRAKEELIVVKFREFLQCVESKYRYVFVIQYIIQQGNPGHLQIHFILCNCAYLMCLYHKQEYSCYLIAFQNKIAFSSKYLYSNPLVTQLFIDSGFLKPEYFPVSKSTMVSLCF